MFLRWRSNFLLKLDNELASVIPSSRIFHSLTIHIETSSRTLLSGLFNVNRVNAYANLSHALSHWLFVVRRTAACCYKNDDAACCAAPDAVWTRLKSVVRLDVLVSEIRNWTLSVDWCHLVAVQLPKLVPDSAVCRDVVMGRRGELMTNGVRRVVRRVESMASSLGDVLAAECRRHVHLSTVNVIASCPLRPLSTPATLTGVVEPRVVCLISV